jgi:predicted HAD superfamily Cof-like phosphohydrolase
MSLFISVRNFMRRFGQFSPVPFIPQAPPDDVVRNRCRWQLEETIELLLACFPNEADRADIRNAQTELNAIIREADVKVDMVEYADANADIRYVACGNDIAAGVDSDPIDDEVIQSNDTKMAPEVPGGKVQKGPNYQPPRIAERLRDQGWKG